MSSASGTPDQISAWLTMHEALEALGQQLGVVPLGVSVAAERERAEEAEAEAANWKALYEREKAERERTGRHRDQVLARIEAIRAALQATS